MMMTSANTTGTFSSSSSSDSPGNSLDRNIKPSDILRQKSAENANDIKAFAINRKTIPDPTTMVNRLITNPELLEELGQKIKKSELSHAEKDIQKSSSLERGKALATKNVKNSTTMPTEMISSNTSSVPNTGSLDKNLTSSSYHHRKPVRKNSTTKSETISPSSKADLVSINSIFLKVS